MRLAAVTTASTAFGSVVTAAPPQQIPAAGADLGRYPPRPPQGKNTKCYTHIGSAPGSSLDPTSWSTICQPCVSTITSTVIMTISLTMITTLTTTSTITTSTTTTTTTTTTSSILATITSTTTATKIKTRTATKTATVARDFTTFFPAPDWFIPVQSSLPGSTILKRDVDALDADMINEPSEPLARGSVPGFNTKQSFVHGVSCYFWEPEKCSIMTTTITTTVTASPTLSVRSVAVVLSTTLSTTSASTTSGAPTVTSTVFDTITTTTTSTVTSTTYTSTISSFGQCATNNIADHYKGNPVAGAGFPGALDRQLNIVSADTAYDCCVESLFNSDGSGEIWMWNVLTEACYVFYKIKTFCPADSQAVNKGGFYPGNSQSGASAVGNGACGEITKQI